MKAFGYLLAGAALLGNILGTVALNPAPNSALQNGWKYKGCYSYATVSAALRMLSTHNSQRHKMGCCQRQPCSERLLHPLEPKRRS